MLVCILATSAVTVSMETRPLPPLSPPGGKQWKTHARCTLVRYNFDAFSSSLIALFNSHNTKKA